MNHPKMYEMKDILMYHVDYIQVPCVDFCTISSLLLWGQYTTFLLLEERSYPIFLC